MIAHVLIRLGPWMFTNGHLYRLGTTGNAKYSWPCWRCVFCRRVW